MHFSSSICHKLKPGSLQYLTSSITPTRLNFKLPSCRLFPNLTTIGQFHKMVGGPLTVHLRNSAGYLWLSICSSMSQSKLYTQQKFHSISKLSNIIFPSDLYYFHFFYSVYIIKSQVLFFSLILFKFQLYSFLQNHFRN